LAFIEAGLGTPIKVQDVAEHCDVNRRTLELTFSEHCGDTLGGHLKRRQLEHAAAQLRCTSKPVQTVASEIGHRSPGAFARAFERQFGLTPTSWRKSGAKA
jgi:transcriptional regulator GlxA family with amidase domain